MPEFILDRSGAVVTPSEEIPFRALDEFTQGYIEAMFFTDEAPGVSTEEWLATEAAGEEHQEGCFPSDVGYSDLAPDSLAEIIADCKAFQEKHAEFLDRAYELTADGLAYTPTRAGHDFWFTRNGHGVGYWSRDFKDDDSGLDDCIGDALSDCAKEFRQVDSYLGDDGKVHLS